MSLTVWIVFGISFLIAGGVCGLIFYFYNKTPESKVKENFIFVKNYLSRFAGGHKKGVITADGVKEGLDGRTHVTFIPLDVGEDGGGEQTVVVGKGKVLKERLANSREEYVLLPKHYSELPDDLPKELLASYYDKIIDGNTEERSAIIEAENKKRIDALVRKSGSSELSKKHLEEHENLMSDTFKFIREFIKEKKGGDSGG